MRLSTEVGSTVFNEYHRIRRYGIVLEKRIGDNGWGYCRVKWFDDGVYEAAMSDRQKLTNKDWSLDEYRIDQLQPIDLHREIETLEDIRHELNFPNMESINLKSRESK